MGVFLLVWATEDRGFSQCQLSFCCFVSPKSGWETNRVSMTYEPALQPRVPGRWLRDPLLAAPKDSWETTRLAGTYRGIESENPG